MSAVEPLYFGDKRLDNLLAALEEEIYHRCVGQEISIVTVIGVLERIQWRLQQEMDNE